jgi:hypothetical protein
VLLPYNNNNKLIDNDTIITRSKFLFWEGLPWYVTSKWKLHIYSTFGSDSLNTQWQLTLYDQGFYNISFCLQRRLKLNACLVEKIVGNIIRANMIRVLAILCSAKSLKNRPSKYSMHFGSLKTVMEENKLKLSNTRIIHYHYLLAIAYHSRIISKDFNQLSHWLSKKTDRKFQWKQIIDVRS